MMREAAAFLCAILPLALVVAAVIVALSGGPAFISFLLVAIIAHVANLAAG